MNQKTVGENLKKLRLEKGYTQTKLGELLGVSDRAVSKWERGLGCPDLSIWPHIAEVFQVDVSKVIFGQVSENKVSTGNMKNTKFYVCPVCRSLTSSAEEVDVFCCSRKLEPATASKGEGDNLLKAEVEGRTEVFLSSGHPMEKDHYISFVSYVTSDSILSRRLYPEWGVDFHLPYLGHGRIYWNCTKDGLFYITI